ncbi:MAG: VOC family protein [Geminicoccaceae bacterium]
MQVKGFNHTGIVVSELDRPIAFFCECLGFELLSRAPRGDGLIEKMTTIPKAALEVAYLQGPGHRIELIRYGNDEGRRLACPKAFDTGSSHVAFDVVDVDEAVAAANGYGFSLVGEIIEIDGGPNKGRKVVYMHSPDGILIEFISSVPAD